MDNEKNSAKEIDPYNDNEPKVTGIGGIFFYAKELDHVKDWYAKNLGFKFNDWGAADFQSRDLKQPDRIDTLQWTPFQKGDDYFSPSPKEYMINYKVKNIEALVDKLKKNGVVLLDEIVSYDYGKFVHIMDLEGNKIELWEPS